MNLDLQGPTGVGNPWLRFRLQSSEQSRRIWAALPVFMLVCLNEAHRAVLKPFNGGWLLISLSSSRGLVACDISNSEFPTRPGIGLQADLS